ncbi:hypothetical protein L596_020318 [Steinernema carpocapsae]|uniref:Uncharacterized protein n=1 Tax=Steinernema carpocapsae TaxID=34508 RepID=A0A4U5MT64_STECR|nr:hypothetical protein L596_020318 [Steinernema carpocapsae]
MSNDLNNSTFLSIQTILTRLLTAQRPSKASKSQTTFPSSNFPFPPSSQSPKLEETRSKPRNLRIVRNTINACALRRRKICLSWQQNAAQKTRTPLKNACKQRTSAPPSRVQS